jgi:hypothetical protein
MTNDGKQTDNAGPCGIPLRESTGITGPSREVSQTDNTVPGTGVTRPANDELTWAKKHMSGHRTVHQSPKAVFRKTELLGIAPPTGPDEIKKARQRTLKNIRDPDGLVAYRRFEDAFRDFICSLVERQDTIYDEMLLHVADLQQRIDLLEQRLEETRHASPGGKEASG